MMMGPLWCVNTVQVLRNADLGNGRTGAPVVHLAALPVSNPYPASRNTVEVMRIPDLNSPRELKEVYHCPATPATALPDVKEGDLLVFANETLTVMAVAEWPDWALPSLLMLVQEIKKSA